MLHRKAVLPATLELLTEIMSKDALSDFYLAGGTALALQIGHRISVDLDLFGNRPFAPQDILYELEDYKPVSIMAQSKNILILNVKGVKVDFVNYKYPLIMDPIEMDGLRLLSVQDIAAMKLSAIAGRGRKRDFYDLFFLLQLFSLDELIAFYLKKYEEGSELMLARSLVYFDDAEEDDDPRLLQSGLNWDSIKRKILQEVKMKYT